MTTSQQLLILIITLTGVSIGLFVIPAHIDKEILPTPSPLNTIMYNSGSTPPQITYALPNGLILFDTKKPTIWPIEYDHESDESITKYVGRNHALNDLRYVPDDLVTISDEWIINRPTGMQIRTVAHTDLNLLAQEFYEIFDKKLVIVSAYRSYDHQRRIAGSGCPVTLCARPWHSEHQLGLTIDIFAATTAGQFLSRQEFRAYYEWLMQNAHRYGRHNTYQRWPAIDGYQPEPRHRRYLWRGLANELFARQTTFGEWYQEKTGDR